MQRRSEVMRSIVGSSLFVLASCAAMAQARPTPLAFDVASVKPSAPGPDGFVRRVLAGGPGSTDPGTLTYQNVTLKMLVTLAYNLKDYQVEGPDWINGVGYDVTAKMPEGTNGVEMRQMLQTLLAERFKVTSHRETKQLPIYALTVAKGGPKMKEMEMPALADASQAGPGAGRGGPPPVPGAGMNVAGGPGGR